MLKLAAAVAAPDEVGWVLVAEHRQGLFVLSLFDVAVCGKVAAGGAPRD